MILQFDNMLRVLKSRTLFYAVSFFVTLVPSVTSAQEAAPSVNDLFVQAEQNTLPEEQVQLWLQLREVLKQDKGNYQQDGINLRLIEQNIVNSYVKLFTQSLDFDALNKAKQFIRSFPEQSDQAWAYVYILEAINLLAHEDLYGYKIDLVDDIDLLAQKIQDKTVQSRLYYALSYILLSRDENNKPLYDTAELKLVHRFIRFIFNSAHRSDVLTKYVELVDSNTGILPRDYRPLYALKRKNEKKDQPYISIHEAAVKKGQFNLALDALLFIENKNNRVPLVYDYFKTLYDNEEFSRALRVAQKMDNPSKAVNAWSLLTSHYTVHGYDTRAKQAHDQALGFVDLMKSEESKNKAQNLIKERQEKVKRTIEKNKKEEESRLKDDIKKAKSAMQLLDTGDIPEATQLVKKIEDRFFRVKTYRSVAEQLAKKNDKYNILETKYDDKPFFTLSGTETIGQSDITDVDAYEGDISNRLNDDPYDILTKEGLSSSTVGMRIKKDSLPQKLKYDGEYIQSITPLSGGASLKLSYYENNMYNSKFYGVYGNAGHIKQQNTTTPKVIIIENGVVDLSTIHDWLVSIGRGNFLSIQDGIYHLHRPIVISHGAALVVAGDNVKDLRLSTQSGSYLVNVGDIYIADTIVSAWNDKKQEPMWATYKEKRNYRPYLTSWSRSNTYIGNSEIIALGYANGKSYGLSLSNGPNEWMKMGNKKTAKRPTGIITDNSFNNTLYGFYSYEADDVSLIGNEYIDNVVYGIDPHDRSNRLVIAYNTAYDTYIKHGIIISREVNDSLIFGNVSFDNAGTGIMLDRDSNQTIVYANTAFHNKQDGLTVFESDCEIIAANHLFENNGSGFRIRNSYNIGLFYNDVVDNRLSGIAAYTHHLIGNDAHKHRDFELDPYDTLTTVTAVGNLLQSNGTGIFVDKIQALFMKQNDFIDQSPKVLRGKWFEQNPGLLFQYDRENHGVSLNNTCPDLSETLYVQSCKFRNDSTLFGDGQDQLIERIKNSACSKSIIHGKKPYSGGEK